MLSTRTTARALVTGALVFGAFVALARMYLVTPPGPGEVWWPVAFGCLAGAALLQRRGTRAPARWPAARAAHERTR